MKRIGIMTLILFAGLISMAWAQRQALPLHMGKHGIPDQRLFNALSRSSATTNPTITAQVATTPAAKVYDLGHYPGGTWALSYGINESGVVVGRGDIPEGYFRPIGVPLFGPDAGQWFDLGTLGGERTDYMVACGGIADTGMIVGWSALPGGEPVHAFAWTPKSGMVDIGSLSGERNWSEAATVNKSGTLIVGWSASGYSTPDQLPVVWTPKVLWGQHGPAITWNIHQLDTTGFEQFTWTLAMGVNNFGQISGVGVSADGLNQIVALWNPLPGGKGWKIMQLPVTADYPYAWADGMNDKGEIVGMVISFDYINVIPVVWKPVNQRRSTYSLTRLPTLTGSDQGYASAWSINNLGDIVGCSFDADGNLQATHWSTQDPSFIEVLPFPGPGIFSWAQKVNDRRIVVGNYSDFITDYMAAVQLR
jgi:probable HAF family extracellular repeat protein